VQPLLRVDRDVVIDVDARKSKPVMTTVDRPDLRPNVINIGFTRFYGEGSAVAYLGYVTTTFDGLFTAGLGEAVPAEEMSSYLYSGWGVPGPKGDFVDSPVLYHLFNTVRGGIITDFTRAVRAAELGGISNVHHAQVIDRMAIKNLFASSGHYARGIRFHLPSKVTHFVEPAPVTWTVSAFREFTQEPGGPLTEQTALVDPLRAYQAGKILHARWNAAPFGPLFADAANTSRYGDEIYAAVPMFGDADGHLGGSRVDTASTRLLRNGALVAESADPGYVYAPELPGERGDFALETSVTRPSVSDLSTRLELRWTFSSQTASQEGEVLPLRLAHFRPAVDAANTARRQPVSVLPVRLTAPEGVKAGDVRAVGVQVSGDDGGTWQTATVTRIGNGSYVAKFRTPAGARHISLRAAVSGTDGTTMDQTIIRAYGLR
jgi:hypothetical protein